VGTPQARLCPPYALSSLRGALATKQSSLASRGTLDCFAEPVIGRRFAPTRWLAMTEFRVRRVGKAKRAHHPLATHGIMLRMGGGHGARAPLPTLRAIVIARSTCDEAIQSCCDTLDCFAEPVIGRRFAPTRWLAMTEFRVRRVGKAKRAHHPLVTHGIMLRKGGGHGASAPLPTLRAIINLTKPDFSKKAGRFLRWRKKNRWHR
jgi:hypothetical protein